VRRFARAIEREVVEIEWLDQLFSRVAAGGEDSPASDSL
jgi:hypothetical protein